VREFAGAVFPYAGLDYRRYVKPDAELYRPAEGNLLGGDAGKTRRALGWTLRIGFEELVRDMVGRTAALGIEHPRG
jgi:GDPmannose 4,6-dehydratase